MLSRLPLSTARAAAVVRRLPGGFNVSCIRTYSSDSGVPPGDQGKAPSAANERKEAPLSALLDHLSSINPGMPSPSSKGMPNQRQTPNSKQALKGDFSGLIGSGRYGGPSDRLSKEASTDPMSLLILHVHASSNNTILSLTDANGRVIVNASGGTVGFKKAQRAGFEAAYQATASIASTVKERGITARTVELRLKGFGAGRDAAFKAVHSVTNWVVTRIVDTTPIPFNGCRPKKARRL